LHLAIIGLRNRRLERRFRPRRRVTRVGVIAEIGRIPADEADAWREAPVDDGKETGVASGQLLRDR